MKHRSSGEASSVEWYNLEKTKAAKEYCRFSEFGDYIPMEDCRKHGEKENRISSSDFAFEVQEQDKQLESSGEERTSREAKRTRWLCLPKNANSTYLECSLSAETTSSKSTECDSFASKLQDPDDDQVVVKRKMLKLKEQLKAHDHQQSFDVYHNRDVETGEYLEDLHRSAFLGNGLAVNTSHTETALVDVNLTVKPSYRAENVPFVSLTSKLNGKAILGYPLEIRELTNGSETFLHKCVARKLLDEEGSGFARLVWRTSKRTPVCYVTNSLSSSISNNGLASNGAEDSSTPARENNLLINEQSFMKLFKNPEQEKLGKAGLCRTCVPVDLIFSKLLAAVDQIQS